MTDRRSTSGVAVLVVDLDGVAASELAGILRQRGFEAAAALNGRQARAAISTSAYGILVVIADLSRVDDRHCLATLRRQAPRAWIIAVSVRPHPDAQRIVFQSGADSLLTVPFSIEELIFRLWAFSHRSRPT